MALISTAGYIGEFLPLILKRIERVRRGKTHVMLKCNLPKKSLDSAFELSKGMSSPTVNQLADQDWVAIEVAIERKEVHQLMDQLLDLGATGILSHELSLCVPN
jgi:ATP phosphoribosyltransferase